jgi:FkbH-like protein
MESILRDVKSVRLSLNGINLIMEDNTLTEQKVLPVNLCASFVIEPLEDYLKYWSNEVGMDIQVSFAPYNQVFQQLLDPNSLLNQSKGINFLFIRVEDWVRDQKSKPAVEQIGFVTATYEPFIEAVKHASKKLLVPCVVGIVPLSPHHMLSLETATYVEEINQKLDTFLKDVPGFHLLDLPGIAALYNTEQMFDPKSDEIGHIPFTEEYFAALGTYLVRKVRAYKTPAYKVIALDCDNTLWKGICGEDGALHVVIDKEYTYLQQFLLEKYQQGFVLVLCSKNNEADVWEVFDKHPGMQLKREHIAAYRINWDPKPGNLASIAKELNLGLDSFIFLDDNPFEVEQVMLGYPEVFSILLPQESDASFDFLDHIWEFDVFQITEEDLQRNSMYIAEKQRKEEQTTYAHLDDFLQSLAIKVNLRALRMEDLDRALQLTLRTNQFNMNGIRKTREDLLKSMDDNGALNWIVDVEDRFGDYGSVGVVLAKSVENKLLIDTFLLSCRVLGRKVEDFILSELQQYRLSNQLHSIEARFCPTSKNQPFAEFMARNQLTVYKEKIHQF